MPIPKHPPVKCASKYPIVYEVRGRMNASLARFPSAEMIKEGLPEKKVGQPPEIGQHHPIIKTIKKYQEVTAPGLEPKILME